MTAETRLVSFNRETLGVVAINEHRIDWLIERRTLCTERATRIYASLLWAGNQLPHTAQTNWLQREMAHTAGFVVYLPRRRAGLIKNVGILINVYKHQQVNLIEASFKAL